MEADDSASFHVPAGTPIAVQALDAEGRARFRRGDTNADGALNLTDPVVVLGHLFLGGEPPGCLEAADSNDDGKLDITDGIYSLNHLFLGGPAPASPFPECGLALESGALTCERYDPCK